MPKAVDDFISLADDPIHSLVNMLWLTQGNDLNIWNYARRLLKTLL